MSTSFEKLGEVFTEEFVVENKNLDNMDDIYQAVLEKDPSIPREDFNIFMEAVSDKMHSEEEISEEKLEDVSGGAIGVLAVIGAIAAVCAIVTFQYQAGGVLAKTVYNIRNRG